MFQAGQKFGQYELVKKLAKGGFGEVWLAEKESALVTKKVAVKLPHPGQVNFDAIRQEANLWEQASGHPNVLPLIDADIYDGQIVIVSEYIEGGSLADRLRTHGKLPIAEAVRISIGVLRGLEYLHSKNIIHRDIKPANILMQGDVPRLADFGISRVIETTLVSTTVVGTHPYMSPEAFEGVRSVQSDIWSIGVLLYHLATGRLPFPLGKPTEIMYAVLMNEPLPLPDEIPPLLQQIIYKSLEKDRELPKKETPRRYQTAAAMRADLESFLEWLAAQPISASSYETVKVFPHGGVGADSLELGTRMRIPLRERKNFWQSLGLQKISATALFALLFGVGAIIVLLAVLMSGKSALNTSNATANVNAANSDAIVQPAADDAAIRASKEFYRQADELYARKKFDAAIEKYTLAIELNPNDYALYNNRGAAYHATREYQKAIADYTKAAELNPYHFSAYNNRGAAYEDIGDIQRAVADYQKALELDPENKLAKDNLKKILK